MIRRSVMTGLVAVILACPAMASAQSESGGIAATGGSQRPTGFAISVDLSASAGSTLFIFDEYIPLFGFMTPQLSMGAQIRSFYVGLQLGLNYWTIKDEDDSDEDTDPSRWNIVLGPRVDGEIWSSNRAALFLGGGIDVVLYPTEDENRSDNGFNLDFYFGGRVYVVQQLSIGLRFGTCVGAIFSKEESEFTGDDFEYTTVTWSIYGALAFRFVASR